MGFNIQVNEARAWLPLLVILAAAMSLPAEGQQATSAADTATTTSLPATPRAVVMLKDCFSKDFAQDASWNDGSAELAVYAASSISAGQRVEYDVRMATKLEGATREFYTLADYPYGDKPITEVLFQATRWQVGTNGDALNMMTTVLEPTNDFGRTMKLVISAQEDRGITTKTFELWGEKPRMAFASHWDGEGTGMRELGSNLDDYFEEELPLVLRGLKFRDGLHANFWLHPPQANSRATEPRAVSAFLDVKAGNESWEVAVKARDDRRIDFVFAAKSPFVMKEFRHSDGRTMILKDAQRGNSWADVH